MSDNDSDVPECDCASESGLLSISETLDLCNISYSREATIAAFKEYFLFLTELYLDPEQIVFPPEEGWEEITITNMQPLGKTDKVIELLRHLPYIKPSGLCHDSTPYTRATMIPFSLRLTKINQSHLIVTSQTTPPSPTQSFHQKPSSSKTKTPQNSTAPPLTAYGTISHPTSSVSPSAGRTQCSSTPISV